MEKQTKALNKLKFQLCIHGVNRRFCKICMYLLLKRADELATAFLLSFKESESGSEE